MKAPAGFGAVLAATYLAAFAALGVTVNLFWFAAGAWAGWLLLEFFLRSGE